MTEDLHSVLDELTPEQQRLLLLRLRRGAQGPPAPSDEPAPLSDAQERLWYLDQLDPGDPTYNLPFAIRVHGPLDHGRLAAAINVVIGRHEPLHTVFDDTSGHPRQRAVAPVYPLLPVHDLRDVPLGDRDTAVRRHTETLALRRFDLTRAPLLATTLLTLGETEHLLLLTVHHIVFDGWSSGIFVADLAAAYRSAAADALPPLPTRFTDVARAQQAQPVIDGIGYWRAALSGAPATTTPPANRLRTSGGARRSARQLCTLPEPVSAEFLRWTRAEGVTVYTGLLASFSILLSRLTGQDDVVLGSPIAGRTRTEVEPLVGCFADTLVMRVQLAGDPTYRAVLHRAQETLRGAFRHQGVSYTTVVQQLRPPRDPRYNPLFQVMLGFSEGTDEVHTAGAVTFTPESVAGVTDFDLFPTFLRDGDRLTCELDYNPDLYFDETIAELTDQWQAIVTQMVAQPDLHIGSGVARRDSVQLSGVFDIAGVLEPMRFWFDWLGRPADVRQTAALTPADCAAAVTLLSWTSRESAAAAIEALLSALTVFRDGSAAPVLVGICSPAPEFAELRERLDLGCAAAGGVTVMALDTRDQAPGTDEFAIALGTAVAHQVSQLITPAGDSLERKAYSTAHLATVRQIGEHIAAARPPGVALAEPARSARNDLERSIAEIWADLLDCGEVGVNANFFALGGHSLLANQVLSAIQTRFGQRVRLAEFLARPTIEQLAALVEKGSDSADSGPSPVARDQLLFAAAAQHRLWGADQLDGPSERHNVEFAVRLTGQLRVDALRAALADVVRRHEVLRTTFTDHDGEPVLVVRDSVEVSLQEWDARAHTGPAVELLHEFASAAFDLTCGPLLRVGLALTGTDEHHLLVSMHHIVCDNWSADLFLAELAALYTAHVTGVPADLPELTVHYADYAQWQRARLRDGTLDPQVAYWSNRLRDAPALLPLPTDYPRGTATGTPSAGRARLDLAPELSEAVRTLAKSAGVSTFTTLLTAFGVLLQRLSGQRDLVLGTPSAGRGRPELDRLIGSFADILPLRIDLDDSAGFLALLADVHEVVIEGQAHAEVPFGAMLEAVRPERNPAYHPIFQCVFNLIETVAATPTMPDLTLTPVDSDQPWTDFDLFLTVQWTGPSLHLALDHRTDLFFTSTAARILRSFETLLHSVTADPGATVGLVELPEMPVTAADSMVVIGSFTVDAVLEPLRFWFGTLGLPVGVTAGPYGQTVQPLLDPDGVLRSCGAVVLLLRWDDWLRFGGEPAPAADAARLTGVAVELLAAIEAFRSWSKSAVVVALCPPAERFADAAWTSLFTRLDDQLAHGCAALTDVSLLPLGSLVAQRYPVAVVHDPSADALGHVPYTGEFFVAAATVIARRLLALRGTTPHSIVLDAHRSPDPALIAALRRQVRGGRRVVLSTGGNPEDLAREWDPSLRLRWDQITPITTPGDVATRVATLVADDRAGWVFCDPDPVICEQVRATAPGLLVLCVPAEPEQLRQFLEHAWPLDLAPTRRDGGWHGDPQALAAIATTLRDVSAIQHSMTAERTVTEQQPYVAPRTETERALADIWAALLRVDQVGIHDDFFALGGESMVAVQLVSRAKAAGIPLTPRQVLNHRTIATLSAASATEAGVIAEQGAVTGEVRNTPAQQWFFEDITPRLPDVHHYNHPYYLELRQRIDPTHLVAALAELVRHHDGLRLRFTEAPAGLRQDHAPADAGMPFETVDLSDLTPEEQDRVAEQVATRTQTGLDIGTGTLIRAVHLDLGAERPSRLLLVCHHLATDALSRPILLEDLQSALRQVLAGEPVRLPAKTTSYRDWAQRLHDYARSPEVTEQLPFWLAQHGTEIPVDHPGGEHEFGAVRTSHAALTEEQTRQLRRHVTQPMRLPLSDVILAALADALASWTGAATNGLMIAGHGRENLFEDVDLTRTVGWFQIFYPLLLTAPDGEFGPDTLSAVHEQLAHVRDNGIGYALLRYTCDDAAIRDKLAAVPLPKVSFNYMGEFGLDGDLDEVDLFGVADAPNGPEQPEHGVWPYSLDVLGSVQNDRLCLDIHASELIHLPHTIEDLMTDIVARLLRLLPADLAADSTGDAK